MKIVIPFLYNKDYIPLEAHKLLCTAIKSYVINKNTAPMVIAITHESTRDILDTLINAGEFEDLVSYEFYPRSEVFSNMDEYANFGHWHGTIARSKYFCAQNVAKGDDIIITDSDVIFLKNIDWYSHIKPGAKVQWFDNEYSHQLNICSGNIGIFVNTCAKARKSDTMEHMRALQASSKKHVDSKMPWPNGGLIYYSKEYRENELSNDLKAYMKTPWFDINLFEDEPFYVYLYHNQDHIEIEDPSSLNKRIYNWSYNEIYDPFNIKDTEMLHYCMPNCKPTSYQFTWDEGFIMKDVKESIYENMQESTIWQDFYTRTASTRIILVIWHYYYSFIASYIKSYDEIVHPPETFMRILTRFKDYNDELIALYRKDFSC